MSYIKLKKKFGRISGTVEELETVLLDTIHALVEDHGHQQSRIELLVQWAFDVREEDKR